MKQTTGVWTERWRRLKAAGLTAHQLTEVFAVMSQARAFHYEHLEESAAQQLRDVIREGELKEQLRRTRYTKNRMVSA